MKPYRIFNSYGVRTGYSYSKLDSAIKALEKLNQAGYVDKLYCGVIAAKNDARSPVRTYLYNGENSYA